MKEKILVWETSEKISGGQRMTLNVVSMLQDTFDFVFVIPKEGSLSKELDKLHVRYYFAGDISLPQGHKKISSIFNYFKVSRKWMSISKETIKNEKPNILYCPGPAALPWSAICGKHFDLPVVWHLHHVFFDKKTRLLLNYYAKFKNVKKIIGVSNVVCEQVKSKRVADKKIVIHNPVDFEKYSNAKDSFKDEFIKLVPKTFLNDSLVFAHIGNIQELKKQDFTIELLDKFSKKHQLKCVCFFAGKIVEEEFYAKFNKLLNKQYKFVHFIYLGERHDIPSILKKIDYVIIPSSEGFPLAALEAMCCGLPLLGASGGAEELIKEAQSGETFEYLNIDSAINALERLIKKDVDYYNNGINYSKESSMEVYKIELLKLFEGVK